MGTRKECREALAVLFTADGSFTAVYDYLPTDLLGASKVICVYIKSTRYSMLSRDLNDNLHRFYLDVLIRRNAGTSEDDLDTLREAVKSVIRANVANVPTWHELNLEQDSDAFFAEIAGEAYRVEQHTLLVKVSET